VILLDEPTAGMSNSETARFIQLIREVTEGKTLLTVEHDMGVVFGLADKIAVVVYGEVIAFDTPERCAPTRACRRPTWARRWPRRRGRTDAEDRDLHAYYGKSHVLHGVASTCSRARSWPCWGATARAAPPPPRPSWAWWTGRADRVEGQSLAGKKAFEIAHLGLGYVPESRDIFPT
jgi:ABC-type branched-subunit amino acid transport system ATPase component